jgi:hypothetical protein
MGFIRQQEEKLARRLLSWHYERQGFPIPAGEALEAQASRIVSEAHRVARQRGSNLVEIMRELVRDLKQ